MTIWELAESACPQKQIKAECFEHDRACQREEKGEQQHGSVLQRFSCFGLPGP